MRYTPEQHLKAEADFKEIRASGIRRECGFFCLNILPRPDRIPPLRRAGFIASRRVGNAVRRNRAKRLLREVFRLHQDRLPPSCDILLIARRSTPNAPLAELERRFLQAVSPFTEEL